jgi:hypothetical protein
LVVADASFTQVLKPLLAHKKDTGMPAVLLTVQQAKTHFKGKDDPEKIKRAIAYAHEHLGIRYVLLAGNPSLVPVRFWFRKNADKGPDWIRWSDGCYLPTDLYYSNLYRGHRKAGASVNLLKPTFDTWDLNGRRYGKFNEIEWYGRGALTYNPDQVDGCPDVALGRVPARSAGDMKVYVEKVIGYESALIPTGPQVKSTSRLITFLAHKGYDPPPDIAASLSKDIESAVTSAGGKAGRQAGDPQAYMEKRRQESGAPAPTASRTPKVRSPPS